MEIVNGHTHLIELEKMIQKYGDIKLAGGISVFSDIESTLALLHPETLLAQMDEADVTKSILFAVDAPIVYSSNEYVGTLCAEYPDRFIGFASVNPLEKDAVGRFTQAIEGLGLSGLKLHPPLQDFFPNDEAVFPLYERAIGLDVPVVFHVGTTPFGSLCHLSQANPLLIDDIAVRFPELRILLTHLGTLWHNEAFMVVEKNPNVFIDTAAYLYEIEDLLTTDLVRRIGPDKIIFGTDFPMPYAGRLHRIKDFVDCVAGLKLQEEIKHLIFSENLKTLLTGKDTEQESISVAELLMKTRERH